MRLLLPLFLSIVYVAFVVWSVSLDIEKLKSLGLNEWGDFLAGFLGPVAIIWLVTGIFLQSYEMRSNTEEVKQGRRVAEQSLSIAKVTNALKNKELSVQLEKQRQSLDDLKASRQKPESLAFP